MSYKLLSFRAEDGAASAGILVGDTVHPVRGLPGLSTLRTVEQVLDDWERAAPVLRQASQTMSASAGGVALGRLTLLQPVANSGAIYCSGGNYHDHVAEMQSLATLPAELTIKDICGAQPWHFIKPARGCVVGPDTTVRHPGCQNLDWEIELVAVIGRKAKNVPVDRALDYVAGYTIANDLSARDRAVRREIHPTVPFRWDWTGHKCFEGSLPLGPWITPADEIPNPHDLKMKTWVNDELMQDSSSSQMIFSVAEQIALLSTYMTLNPGDLVSTGTPAGVGSGRGKFLAVGDKVRLEIERIGQFGHTIGD